MGLPHALVLAEKAVQLYRDTDYGDLISFEEDIARIAAVVLVIAESPGSLAELGAFTANDAIRRVLRVVIQQKFETQESFVRFGPIERVRKAKRDNLGVYPWRVRSSGKLIISSARPHISEIKKFINEHVEATPTSTMYSQLDEASLFYVVYWIIYLCLAVEIKNLCKYVQSIIPTVTEEEINNKVYCMKIAGWIERIAYSKNDYVYALHDTDPFDYSFKPHIADRDSVRRKFSVSSALKKSEGVPRHVSTIAAQARVQVSK